MFGSSLPSGRGVKSGFHVVLTEATARAVPGDALPDMFALALVRLVRLTDVPRPIEPVSLKTTPLLSSTVPEGVLTAENACPVADAETVAAWACVRHVQSIGTRKKLAACRCRCIGVDRGYRCMIFL